MTVKKITAVVIGVEMVVKPMDPPIVEIVGVVLRLPKDITKAEIPKHAIIKGV